MNDGKALERLVAMIQEHLKNLPEVTVTQNAILQNRSGNKREVDVFVKANVNGEEIGIAFECKDYKKNVNIQIIDSFVTKCSELPQVNKGIIVTTSGFTVGAQREAAAHNIGLYLIDDLPLSEILSEYNLYAARVKVTTQKISFHSNAIVDDIPSGTIFLIRCLDDNKTVDVLNSIINTIYNTDLYLKLAATFMASGKTGYQTTLRFSPNRRIYMDVSGEKYEIEYMDVVVTVDVNMDQCRISSQKKYANLNDKNPVLISEYANSMIDTSFVLIESNNDKKSFFFKNQNNYCHPDIVIKGKEKQ